MAKEARTRAPDPNCWVRSMHERVLAEEASARSAAVMRAAEDTRVVEEAHAARAQEAQAWRAQEAAWLAHDTPWLATVCADSTHWAPSWSNNNVDTSVQQCVAREVHLCTAGLRNVAHYPLDRIEDLTRRVKKPNEVMPRESTWPPEACTLLLDCRTYKRHVRAAQHIGTCTSVLQQIVNSELEQEVLNGFLAAVKYFLQTAPPGPLLIVMACDWGKHRSVGTSCLLKHVLTKIGHDVKAEHHLSKPRWSKKGCGWLPCALCDDIGDDKRALFAQVVQRYNALN